MARALSQKELPGAVAYGILEVQRIEELRDAADASEVGQDLSFAEDPAVKALVEGHL